MLSQGEQQTEAQEWALEDLGGSDLPPAPDGISDTNVNAALHMLSHASVPLPTSAAWLHEPPDSACMHAAQLCADTVHRPSLVALPHSAAAASLSAPGNSITNSITNIAGMFAPAPFASCPLDSAFYHRVSCPQTIGSGTGSSLLKPSDPHPSAHAGPMIMQSQLGSARTPPRFELATSHRSDSLLHERHASCGMRGRRVSLRGDMHSLTVALDSLDAAVALCGEAGMDF